MPKRVEWQPASKCAWCGASGVREAVRLYPLDEDSDDTILLCLPCSWRLPQYAQIDGEAS